MEHSNGKKRDASRTIIDAEMINAFLIVLGFSKSGLANRMNAYARQHANDPGNSFEEIHVSTIVKALKEGGPVHRKVQTNTAELMANVLYEAVDFVRKNNGRDIPLPPLTLEFRPDDLDLDELRAKGPSNETTT